MHKQLIHCAHRCTSSLSCAQHCTPPPPRPPSSTAQRAALHSAQHYIAPSTANQDKADRSERTNHIQRAALHSAQRYTVASATQRYTAPSASLRPALHCAQRYTARSLVQCAELYSAPPPPALHSAQHCTAPSTTLHRAQRAKTRPIAASEPSIYKWWNISVSVQRLLRSNGTRPCRSCELAHARAFVFLQ